MAARRDLRRVIIDVEPSTVKVRIGITYDDDVGFNGRLDRDVAAPVIVADAETLVQSIITAAENALGVTIGRG